MPETGPRILLIDDDPDSRALVRLVLRQELPHLILEDIADAVSFAEAFGRADFELVILDPRLSWADGLAVLHALKGRWPAQPVILLTDRGGEELGVRAAKLGADDFLLKSPGGFVNLSLAVLGTLEQARSRTPPAEEPPKHSSADSDFQQLAAMAAHELQEPVRMVERYTRILAEDYKGRLDGPADELLGFAHEGARRLQDLIDGLLAFSRLDGSGKPFQRVESADLLQRALADLGPSIAESGARITHDSLPAIEADPGQIVQLLRNLLGNALKFGGGDPPRVHLSATRMRGEWVFAVQDNGVGMAPEDAQTIFALFARLRPEVPGSGVGLALCRKIVERHGGRIWVESQPGQGSTFFFTFPAEN
ncbi:MAG TPA: ATP-binding protein [Thermoanaerobaculia bacterium]|nr:ATP-binding protein [Thermoanaerobaculia bacterium]